MKENGNKILWIIFVTLICAVIRALVYKYV